MSTFDAEETFSLLLKMHDKGKLQTYKQVKPNGKTSTVYAPKYVCFGKEYSTSELFEELKEQSCWFGNFNEFVGMIEGPSRWDGIEIVDKSLWIETSENCEVVVRFWDSSGLEFFLVFVSPHSSWDGADFRMCYLAVPTQVTVTRYQRLVQPQ